MNGQKLGFPLNNIQRLGYRALGTIGSHYETGYANSPGCFHLDGIIFLDTR